MSQIKVSGYVVNNSPRKGEYTTVDWIYSYAPQVGFDCLDEEQNIVVRVDAVDYGNGNFMIPLQGQEFQMLPTNPGVASPPAVVESNLPAEKKQELAVVEDEALAVYEESVESTEYDSEKYGDYVEGVFREVDDEIMSDDDDDDDFALLGFKPVPQLYIINEHGMLVRHENEMTPRETLKVIEWDETYSYGVAEVNYKQVVTPKFNVTLNLKADEIDGFVRPLIDCFKTSPQELIDITSKEDGKVVIYGQLALIELLADRAGKEIISTDLVCLSIIPANYRVFVKVEPGISEYSNWSVVENHVSNEEILFNIIEDADDLLSPVVFLQSDKYDVHELMYIAMCSLDRYKSFYICKNNLFVPPWSGNVSADVWLPVFKELTLAYFGRADRTKLYDAICKANMLNNVRVPAAAFLCPIEFLLSSEMEALVMYIQKLFAMQRPLGEEHILLLKKLRKVKDFAGFFEVVEKLPNTSNPYPVSTIGLFANEMQDVSMYRQLAGCDDPVLSQQLIQEFTQVLYRKCPKALAAILSAHRQDLTDKQKEKAVNVLKKNI